MKNKIATIWVLIILFGTAQTSAMTGNTSTNSIEINTLLDSEDYILSFADLSPDDNYMLVSSYKPISMFESLNHLYLLDIENKIYGQVDNGITEEESNYIDPASPIGWDPSGDKIYFTILKKDGGNVVICKPDGTDLRVLGSSETTTLSEAISNLGGSVRYRELTFSPDSSKVAYEYEGPDDILSNLWIENTDGTDAFELRTEASDSIWYNSTTICFRTGDGDLMITDREGNPIRTISPRTEDERFIRLTVSPDKKKIIIFSILGEDDSTYPTYIVNIDGSNLLEVEKHKSSPTDSNMSNWQPNGSSIVLEENGDLYIFEGNIHTKRLLYEGDASQVQWFPDGEKVLFIEDRNKIYSIDINGENLFYITDIGQIPSHIWELYERTTVSISPSGEFIVFTSGLSQEGENIDPEPSLSEAKNISAPIFLINTNGTNLTQLTPAINGRYDFLDEWVPDKDLLILDYVKYSDSASVNGRPFLFSLNGEDLENGWKEMPVSQIIGTDNDNPSENSSQTNKVTEQNETNHSVQDESKSKSSPSFRSVDLLACVSCLFLLNHRRCLK